MATTLDSFPPDELAVVIGASGGIGGAVAAALVASGRFAEVVGLSRSSDPALDLLDEASIEAAAQVVAAQGVPIRLVFVATGILDKPEKSRRDLAADDLAHAFAINTIGPALIAKYFLPLLPRDGKSVFAALSARVGSIGDNRLGGWHGYRASKAALNQMLRTLAIELVHARPEAVCVALHPGTVATPLSAGFVKAGLDVQTPDEAAARLLAIIDGLTPADSGGFLDHRGNVVPW